MSDAHGLTKKNLLFTFPVGLRENPSIAALGDVTMEALAKRPAEISQLSLYPRVDELPENLLDILAYDFKVDWWDQDYSLEEKRRVFKDSWYVHKHMGTKAAVETAVRAIYPLANVEEWFEYEGGKPYHFRLHIDLTGEKPVEGKLERVVERVGFYKSLRSHVDSIQYTIRLPEFSLSIGGGVGTQVQMGVPVEPDTYHFEDTLYAGGAVAVKTEMGVPVEPDTYDFTSTLHAGGAFAGRTDMAVPEDVSQPPAITILRTGGVCTIISNLSGED